MQPGGASLDFDTVLCCILRKAEMGWLELPDIVEKAEALFGLSRVVNLDTWKGHVAAHFEQIRKDGHFEERRMGNVRMYRCKNSVLSYERIVAKEAIVRNHLLIKENYHRLREGTDPLLNACPELENKENIPPTPSTPVEQIPAPAPPNLRTVLGELAVLPEGESAAKENGAPAKEPSIPKGILLPLGIHLAGNMRVTLKAALYTLRDNFPCYKNYSEDQIRYWGKNMNMHRLGGKSYFSKIKMGKMMEYSIKPNFIPVLQDWLNENREDRSGWMNEPGQFDRLCERIIKEGEEVRDKQPTARMGGREPSASRSPSPTASSTETSPRQTARMGGRLPTVSPSSSPARQNFPIFEAVKKERQTAGMGIGYLSRRKSSLPSGRTTTPEQPSRTKSRTEILSNDGIVEPEVGDDGSAHPRPTIPYAQMVGLVYILSGATDYMKISEIFGKMKDIFPYYRNLDHSEQTKFRAGFGSNLTVVYRAHHNGTGKWGSFLERQKGVYHNSWKIRKEDFLKSFENYLKTKGDRSEWHSWTDEPGYFNILLKDMFGREVPIPDRQPTAGHQPSRITRSLKRPRAESEDTELPAPSKTPTVVQSVTEAKEPPLPLDLLVAMIILNSRGRRMYQMDICFNIERIIPYFDINSEILKSRLTQIFRLDDSFKKLTYFAPEGSKKKLNKYLVDKEEETKEQWMTFVQENETLLENCGDSEEFERISMLQLEPYESDFDEFGKEAEMCDPAAEAIPVTCKRMKPNVAVDSSQPRSDSNDEEEEETAEEEPLEVQQAQHKPPPVERAPLHREEGRSEPPQPRMEERVNKESVATRRDSFQTPQNAQQRVDNHSSRSEAGRQKDERRYEREERRRRSPSRERRSRSSSYSNEEEEDYRRGYRSEGRRDRRQSRDRHSRRRSYRYRSRSRSPGHGRRSYHRREGHSRSPRRHRMPYPPYHPPPYGYYSPMPHPWYGMPPPPQYSPCGPHTPGSSCPYSQSPDAHPHYPPSTTPHGPPHTPCPNSHQDQKSSRHQTSVPNRHCPPAPGTDIHDIPPVLHPDQAQATRTQSGSRRRQQPIRRVKIEVIDIKDSPPPAVREKQPKTVADSSQEFLPSPEVVADRLETIKVEPEASGLQDTTAAGDMVVDHEETIDGSV